MATPSTATTWYELGFPLETSDPASASALLPRVYYQPKIWNTGSESMLKVSSAL